MSACQHPDCAGIGVAVRGETVCCAKRGKESVLNGLLNMEKIWAGVTRGKVSLLSTGSYTVSYTVFNHLSLRGASTLT